MLVRTPAIRLGVEIRDSKTADGSLILSGVANVMPCTIEMEGRELWTLAARLLRPSVIWLMLKSIFSRPLKDKD